MTVGLSGTNTANAWLNVLRGTTFTGITPFAQMHNADPGASGTTGVASTAITTRQAITWAAPSPTGTIALSATPSWTAAAADTLTHVSVFGVVTMGSGTFYLSAQLSVSKTVATSDTFTLSTLTVSQAPLAA